MDPLTTVTTAWTLAKTAGEISKRLFELGKGIKDRETKQQLDEILESVRELKRSAEELEDQNRGLRERLRFNSDEFEFRNPYWYRKGRPDERLCPKCYSKQIAAPISNANDCCLVCGAFSF